MPSVRVPRPLNDGLFFVSCTVRRWYYLFDRHGRWDILGDALAHCCRAKGLQVYAYVFMINHLHMIVQAPDVAGVLRDFKKHTARELMDNVRRTEPPVAALFGLEAGGFAVWQRTNMPKGIETERFFEQKKRYIEMNPVRHGYVASPEHWVWSSANPVSPVPLAEG